MMPEARVLIFDLDLTLCDNLLRKARAMERALGIRLPKGSIKAVEDRYGFKETLEALGIADKGRQVVDRILDHFFYDMDLFELDRPFKGAVKTLQSLAKAGYKIHYVTGRPLRQTAQRFLKRHGFPEGGIYAEKVAAGESRKKVPLFLEILKAARAKPEEAVAIGDLPGDAAAAKEARMKAIGVCQVYKSMREELKEICDVVIERIDQLPDALRRLHR